VCKDEKELSLFNKAKDNADGFKNICRDCAKKEAKNYSKLPHVILNRRNNVKVYETKNKKKINAKRKLFVATRNGSIVRDNCEVCGTSEGIHGHHDDYNKPLDIRWLCRKHHIEWHRFNGKGLNGD